MDQHFKIKVWKDRMATPHPQRWCWEVWQRSHTSKVVGCGTTLSERASREAAARFVESHTALMRQYLARIDARTGAFATSR